MNRLARNKESTFKNLDEFEIKKKIKMIDISKPKSKII